MKKIIQKINRALQIVLMAPIKLPSRPLNILKYIALGLGVVETVLYDKVEKGDGEKSSFEQSLSQTEKEKSDEIE